MTVHYGVTVHTTIVAATVAVIAASMTILCFVVIAKAVASTLIITTNSYCQCLFYYASFTVTPTGTDAAAVITGKVCHFC